MAIWIALVLMIAVAGLARADEDNPHEKMVRSKSACIDCHTRVPKADEHADDYLLVDAPSETCLGCHSESEHAGVLEHVGKDLPKGATLPVDEHGKIACFTCHDPHPDGVLPGRTVHKSTVSAGTRAFIDARTWAPPLERREPSETFGALLRVPMGREDCLVCHASVVDRPWKERTTWSDAIRVLPR
ncbi:MAG: hypothetical protein ABIR79_03680 [Candidatus Binatia bacterium]